MSEYSFEEAYKTNVVYIYTLNESSHKDCVKVGKASTSKPNPSQEDIFEAAKERVEDQLKTAGLKYKSLYAEIAIRIDSDGVHDYHNSENCFSNVSIKGGVNYFLLNSNYKGKCKYILTTHNSTIVRNDFLDPIGAGVVLRDSKALDIINLVLNVEGNYFASKTFRSMVSPKHFFDKDVLLSSNWRGYAKMQDSKHYIKLYVNRNLEDCGYGWITEDDIPRNKQVIPYHKVFIPKVGGTGTDPHVLGKPFYGEPNSVCSYTYLVIGYEQSDNILDKTNCDAILKYIQSRFFRYLVSIKKKTQDNARDVFQFVPLQDFTSNSDIDWSKSIAEIDQQLYAKYGLSEEEIAFVESMVKPME